jgi:pimeloyl-ACP methyl ester carboxylesterase
VSSAVAGAAPPAWVALPWRGRTVQIEVQWINGTPQPGRPWMVFLHEGLGSVSTWRNFPARLCAAVGACGLVYSRPGYGRSTPRAPQETWGPDFLHQQAHEVLPALLHALATRARRGASWPAPWLVGHSDGGSIALLYAARPPRHVAGLMVLAPHTYVETLSLASIERARRAYREGGLKERLAGHHIDPDSAFWGWNQAWLSPAFAAWNIEAELRPLVCPVLAVQGLDDEYGTLAQLHSIVRAAPHTQVLELPGCGHSPHRDQPEALLAACARFMANPSGPSPTEPRRH